MFTTWAPYALVGAGGIGIWLMQSAFSAGPLQHSLPAIAAGEPLVGLLLGVLVFGDRIQISTGELALQAAGIAALVAGVILVGRAPALSQLRGWPPGGLAHITDSLPSLPPLPALPGHGGRARRYPGGRQRRQPDGARPEDYAAGEPEDRAAGDERLNGHAPAEPGRAAEHQQADRPNPSGAT
jgi:hypothetical protein